MELTKLLSDEAILSELGERLSRSRLDLQLTQAEVAEQAGIAKRTLERMEAGHSSQLSSLIRVPRTTALQSPGKTSGRRGAVLKPSIAR